MKDFKRGGFRNDRGGNRGGFGGNRGGRDFGGDRRGGFDGPRTMYKTICSECGKTAEVPFKPSNDKPVLCSDCFSPQRENRSNDRGNNRNDRDRGFGNRDRQPSQSGNSDFGKLKEEVASLHVKMDSILKLLGGKTEKKEETFKEKESQVKVPKREKPAPAELTKVVKKAVESSKKKVVKKVAKKAAKKK